MKTKILILIFFLVTINQLFAQKYQVRGVLCDKDLKEPIPFAAVGVDDFSTGTITNNKGEFNLKINKETDSLIVSHLNYGKQFFAFSKNSNEQQTFHIKSKEILLDEVIVTNVPISKILLDAVKKSEESLSLPVLLHTYYREFVQTDGKYTKFSDGLLNYHLSGAKKLKSDVSVVDSRSVELYDESEEEIDSEQLTQGKYLFYKTFD